MEINDISQLSEDGLEQTVRDQLATTLKSKRHRVSKKFLLAALGSIPWVGGFIAALLTLKDDARNTKTNQLQNQWLEEHSAKMNRLAHTLVQIVARPDDFGEDISKRIESEEYLALVRKGFRAWDKADNEEKRELIRRLLTNAGATTLCPDDLIRLFIDWIDYYHEAHFMVIRVIYRNPGVTRGRIWEEIHDVFPKEDSSEADLFKLLIRDLSTGGVIRQHRETNQYGQFLKKPSRRGRQTVSRTMKSAFDDTDPYVLTELGKQFVHYCMDEAVLRLGEGGS